MLKLPHDERVARLRDPAARAEMRDAVEHYNRDPGARARRSRRRCGTRSTSTRSPSPSTQKCQSRSIREIADELGVAPADAMLDLALDEDLATRFRWRTESPEWAAAVGEAQLDARMIDRRRPTAARTSPATTAPTGARTSSARGCSTARCGRSRRASARSRRCPRRCVGLVDRGVLAPGRARRPDGLRPRHDRAVEEGVRARPPRRRRAASRRGAGACRPPIVNGEPIVLHGELTGRLPGQVVRPGDRPTVTDRAATCARDATPWVFDADGHVVEPPRVWDELAAGEVPRATRHACSSTTATSTSRAATASASASRAAARRWARRARPPRSHDDAGRGARRHRARPAARRHGRRPHRRRPRCTRRSG